MPVLGAFRLPQLVVEVAFNAGYTTPDRLRIWTDVSRYVQGEVDVPISRGRGDEHEQVQPSRLSVTLDNRDGRFTPGRAASPYFPNVKKGRPLRVSVVYDGVKTVRFTGYVDEWPVVWTGGTVRESSVTVTASSRRARMGQGAAFQTGALFREITQDNPTSYWPLNETWGGGDYLHRSAAFIAFYSDVKYIPVFADRAGATDEGSMIKILETQIPQYGYLAGELGQVVAAAGDGTVSYSLRGGSKPDPFTGGSYSYQNFNIYNRELTDRVEIASITLLTPGVSSTFTVSMTITVDPDDDGPLTPVEEFIDYGGPAEAPENYDQLHRIAFTVTNGGTKFELFVDGISRGTTTIARPIRPLTYIYPGSSIGFSDGDWWVGQVAAWNSVVPADRQLAQAKAARDYPGETAAERAERIAGWVGVDPVEVTATDDTIVVPQSILGRSAGAILDELVEGTASLIYDARDGTLVVPDRDDRFNVAASVSASGATDQIEADLTPVLDDQYLINDVTVTVGETTRYASDAESIAEYGYYHADRISLAADPGETEGIGDALVARYSEPQVRIKQVGFALHTLDATLRNQILAAEIGTKLTITDLPAQAPASSMNLFVEGYTETISALAHTITFTCSPGDGFDAWVLDDAVLSVLDSTTILPY